MANDPGKVQLVLDGPTTLSQKKKVEENTSNQQTTAEKTAAKDEGNTANNQK